MDPPCRIKISFLLQSWKLSKYALRIWHVLCFAYYVNCAYECLCLWVHLIRAYTTRCAAINLPGGGKLNHYLEAASKLRWCMHLHSLSFFFFFFSLICIIILLEYDMHRQVFVIVFIGILSLLHCLRIFQPNIWWPSRADRIFMDRRFIDLSKSSRTRIHCFPLSLPFSRSIFSNDILMQ